LAGQEFGCVLFRVFSTFLSFPECGQHSKGNLWIALELLYNSGDDIGCVSKQIFLWFVWQKLMQLLDLSLARLLLRILTAILF